MIDVTLNRYVLRPPNHKLSAIIATVVAEDKCDPSVDVRLTSIESNKPDAVRPSSALLEDVNSTGVPI